MGKENKTIHDFEFVGRLINILKILQEETDEHTTITQPRILELLNERECPCSARTLTDYLKSIMKEVNPEDTDGYVYEHATMDDYIIIPKGLNEKLRARELGLTQEGSKKLQLRSMRYNQLLTFDELNQVIEAVIFLKNLDDKEKEKLIQKLLRTSSKHFPQYSPYVSETTGAIYTKIKGVFENSRIDEHVVRENIRIIQDAVEADNGIGRKISFHFNAYNQDKEITTKRRKDGSQIEYVVNPYYVIFYNGKPYLICAKEPYRNVAMYRIDLMSDVEVMERAMERSDYITKRRPKSEIHGLPIEWTSKEAARFQSEHLYMYHGEPKKIHLKIDQTRYTVLHDYFGDYYKFIRHIDEKYDEVVVNCVPEAMIAWVLQCSGYVEVLKPASLRNSIREQCEKLLQVYS